MSNPTELPDLDRLTRFGWKEAYLGDTPELIEDPDGTYVRFDDVLALARRAQPEGGAQPVDDQLQMLVREYGNTPLFGDGRTRRHVMDDIRALAAQSQGAQAAHCDPAEGFCAACREQERAQQAAAPGAPDGWIGTAEIQGEATSVAFRNEKTARSVCSDIPFPFWTSSSSVPGLCAKPAAALTGKGRAVLWNDNYATEPWVSSGYRPLYLAAPSAPGTPEAPADIDYSIDKGDTVYHKMWRLTSLEVVDVNWALRAIAARLGPTGAVVVWPAVCLSKTPYDDRAAQLDGGQGEGK